MLTRHLSRRLAAHLDGQLPQPKSQEAELHLRECPLCQVESEQVKWGMAAMEHLPPVEAPDSIWSAIETALRENQSQPAPSSLRWRWVLAAIGLLVLVGAAWWRLAAPFGMRWEVARLEGSPSVGAKPLRGVGRIAAGEWIETDAASRATVKVGTIGSVEVAPNTRLRVVTAQPGEHRLELARGEIRAAISAPPKLFFVDTASGTAVDLGCEYALNTDENGSGLLRVTKGWVAFQWKGLESLVPAGASCRTHPYAGPGIPYFDDAPEPLRQALEFFGVAKTGDEALDTILSTPRVRDTLTLWHLLSRVGPVERARVFDRIVALTPLPAGVSREKALQLDAETLKHWREELAWKW